jgi:hypothetical protein
VIYIKLILRLDCTIFGLIPYAYIVRLMAISYTIYYSEMLNLKVNYENLKLIREIQTNLILRFYSAVPISVSNYCQTFIHTNKEI